MELKRDIITNYIGKLISDELRRMDINSNDVVDTTSSIALTKIRDIVIDETLNDPECFHRIEEIINILDEAGIDYGTRHDFG